MTKIINQSINQSVADCSSNSGTTWHGGIEEGKLYFLFFKFAKGSGGSLGLSVLTNFVAVVQKNTP